MKHAAADLRHRIMDAGIRLFAEKGFFTARVEDIARRARVAKGTVYLYFKDKPSLYAGIIDQQFTDGIRFLKETQAKRLTNADKLRVIAKDWLAYMLKYKHQFPMFTMENVNMSRKVLRGIHTTAFQRINEIIDQIAQIIKAGTATGEFHDVDPRVGALYFLNMIQGSFLAHIILPNAKGTGRSMIEIFLNGLKKR